MRTRTFVELVAYTPVFINLLISLVFVYLVYSAQFFVQATVFPETGTGAEAASAGLMNAVVMLVFALLGGFGIVYIIKKRREDILLRIFIGAFFFITTFVTYYMFTSLYQLISRPWSYYYIVASPLGGTTLVGFMYSGGAGTMSKLMLLSSVANGAILTYGIFRERRIVESNTSLIFMASMTGAFMAVLMPVYTSVFLLVLLSAYDIYAVFRGPIKHIAEYTSSPPQSPPDPQEEAFPAAPEAQAGEEGLTADTVGGTSSPEWDDIPVPTVDLLFEEDLDTDSVVERLVYRTPLWDLGLGDLVFYSMLTAMAFMYGASNFTEWGLAAPWVPFLLSALGVMVGLRITISLLERNYMLPALPLSVLFGLTGLGVSIMIHALV